jgi:SpoIIAA-like
MPVAYEIDPNRALIRTTCSGQTTRTEVVAHFDVLERDASCPGYVDVLLDLAAVTSVPARYQLRAVADRIRSVQRPRFGRCAIVADRGAMFKLALKFDNYAMHEFRDLEVFRIASEAEEWLGGPEKSPGSSGERA